MSETTIKCKTEEPIQTNLGLRLRRILLRQTDGTEVKTADKDRENQAIIGNQNQSNSESNESEIEIISEKIKTNNTFEEKLIENECKICHNIFETEEQLLSHQNVFENDDNIEYKCCECHLWFDSLISSSNHSQRAHQKTDNQFSCDECDEIFETFADKYNHLMQNHSKDMFECIECKEKFISETSYENHIKNIPENCHKKANKLVYYCCDWPGCSHSNARRSALEKHLQSHTKDKLFYCDVDDCNQVFSLEASLNAHRLQHQLTSTQSQSNETFGKILCFKCKKAFDSLANLGRHLTDAHKIPNVSVIPQTIADLASFAGNPNLTQLQFRTMPTISVEPIEPNTKYQCFNCKIDFDTQVEMNEHLASVHDCYPNTFDNNTLSQTLVPFNSSNTNPFNAIPITNLTVVPNIVNIDLGQTSATNESQEKHIYFVLQPIIEKRKKRPKVWNEYPVFDPNKIFEDNECAICGKKFSKKSELLAHRESVHFEMLAKYECSWKCCSFMTMHENEWIKHQLIHEKLAESVINKRHYFSTLDLHRFGDKIIDFSDSIQEFEFDGNRNELADIRNRLDSLKSSINLLICGLEEIELSEELNESNDDNNSGNDETIDFELIAASNENSNEENIEIIEESVVNRMEESTKYWCDWDGCEKAFDKNITLEVHRLLKHQTKSFRCELAGCGAAFTQEMYLQMHQNLHENNYQCKQEGCQHRARNCRDFHSHRQRHDIDKPFECEANGCYRRFNNTWNMRQHRMAAHPDSFPEVEWLDCPEADCHYRTKLSVNMTKHIRNHLKPNVCDECDKRFVNNSCLRRHQSMHSGPLHKCSECDKVFYFEKILKQHFQRTHSAKTFFCNAINCGKGFGAERDLKLHVRTRHRAPKIVPKMGPKRGPKGGLKSVQCEWDGCDQTFKCMSNMRDHMNRHTGERPHLCTEPGCGKAFKTRTDMSSHRLQHKEHRFVCVWPGCEYKSISKSRLTFHVRARHESKSKVDNRRQNRKWF